MKAAFLRGTNDVRIEDTSVPSLQDGDILVRMKACGVCGTDVEKMRGHHVTPPILGHEVAGEVAQVASRVRGFAVGDRVFAHHHVPCYTCHYCRHGDYTMCPHFLRYNLDPCGFAEYFRVPAWIVSKGGVIKLPEAMSYEEAAFIEPLASCLRSIDKCDLAAGDDVLVIGTGPVGLLHIKLLPLFKVGRIFASDINDFRLTLAKKAGAAFVFNPLKQDLAKEVRDVTEGRGVDVAIVATGSPTALASAPTLVRNGGTVNLFGAPPRGATVTYDASQLFVREISLVPSYSTSELETHMALKLLAAKKIEVLSLITHRFPLESTPAALQCAAERQDCMKVMVHPSSP